ncbi:tripartite tricarboxylate transporter substrate binding protein [Ideonella sp. A 288]|uniref:tripartite tricarboxylate transporter substrate binding protein n=1 Tax=Ideonella sp. A 288 TaxID=1962181 RepID=UPI000B4C0BD7|nr:tripartite tricarboxylate transporter substrate binding protein [Ideonella sp. A 288]
MPPLTRRHTLLTLAAASLAPGLASAQARIDKPIKLVVPYPPGGTTDLLARAVAPRLSERLGQPVIVENRAGAGGAIGSQQVAKAPPDGSTLLFATIATHGIIPALKQPPPYDPVRDFAPVTLVAGTPNVLLANNDLPVRTLADLLALARAKPGNLNFGSTSQGGSPHMSGELLKLMARIDMVHVPYKGGGPMLLDLIGGQIQVAFDNLPSAMAHIQAGKVRALGVTTARRWPATPEIPTIAEAGVPGYEMSAWFGIVAPGGTPAAITTLLQREIAAILRLPEVEKQFLALGAEPGGMSPDDFTRFIAQDRDRWVRVGANGGVKLE